MKMKIGSDTEKNHNYDTFQKHKNRQNWLLLEIGLQLKISFIYFQMDAMYETTCRKWSSSWWIG